MFCPHCGKQLPDGAPFCSACGQPTGARPQVAPQGQGSYHKMPDSSATTPAQTVRLILVAISALLFVIYGFRLIYAGFTHFEDVTDIFEGFDGFPRVWGIIMFLLLIVGTGMTSLLSAGLSIADAFTASSPALRRHAISNAVATFALTLLGLLSYVVFDYWGSTDFQHVGYLLSNVLCSLLADVVLPLGIALALLLVSTFIQRRAHA